MKNSEILAKVLEHRGHTGVRVWWEPITRAMEMCGPGGGWMADTDQRGNEPLGLNFRDALNHVCDAPWLRVTR